MTLHKLTAGDGYTYLTRQVAVVDSTERGRAGLADYYTERGESPGRWVGSGLADVDLAVGDVVTEAQMLALYGEGRHPNADQLVEDAITTAITARAAGAVASGSVTPGRVDVAAITATTQLGQPFPVHSAAPRFRVLVARRVVAANLARGAHRDTPMDAAARAEIRTQVGREMFTVAHGREPVDERELSSFIASQDRAATTAVAGYDLTFTPVKSVSALWAIAPRPVAEAVRDAHRTAVADALSWLETNAVYTRGGAGGVQQLDTTGMIAAAFEHRDSRAGDPNLHTHVAVSNKVRVRHLDGTGGRWLALDGRVLFKAAVCASERYNTRLEAELHARLRLTFTPRPDATGHPPSATDGPSHAGHGGLDAGRVVREIDGIPAHLLALWSTRRAQIDARRTVLAAAFQARHGRVPTPVEAVKLAQQATLETRDPKHEPRTEAEQRAAWRADAAGILGSSAAVTDLVDRLVTGPAGPGPKRRPRGATGVDPAFTQQVVTATVAVVEASRATWQSWHVRAEAERQTRAHPATATLTRPQVDALVEQVVAAVLSPAVSVPLPREDPADLAAGGTPAPLRRADGTSVYQVAGSRLYTSETILAAEQAILDAAARADGHTIGDTHVDVALLEALANGVSLNDAQAHLVRALATCGARVQVAIAPAGSGKTTALATLTRAWTAAGGTIIGLAPSAAAASVLRENITPTHGPGPHTDTVAKLVWHLTHDTGHPRPDWIGRIDARTLILLDEAAMAATTDLAHVVRYAMARGASVRLVGDDAQLASVAAGGVLRDIAATHGAVTLTELVRFTDPAEAAAGLAIRDGDPAGIGFYLDTHRVSVGDLATVTDTAYTGWATDRAAGRDTIMLAPTRELVAQLNARARHDRLTTDGADLPSAVVTLVDGTHASVGDLVITRRNDRRLRVWPTDWVTNGQRWTVRTVHDDGRLHVADVANPRRRVTLPAEYVAAHVQFGYASTIHGAQGITADTSHTVLTGGESRQQLYVALTRGRHANHLHLAMAGDGAEHTIIRPDTTRPPTAGDLLERILSHDQAAASAATTAAALTDPATALHEAATRYRDALATAAVHALGSDWASRIDTIADQSATALTGRTLTDQPAWPTLRSHLAWHTLTGADPTQLLTTATTTRETTTAHDLAAVLDWRLDPTHRRPAGQEPGPLPWLAAIPTALATHPQWGAYLSARREHVTTATAAITTAATGWTPASTPGWARPFHSPDCSQLRTRLAVFRAAHAVPDTDTRPTGPTQPLAADRSVQRALTAQVADTIDTSYRDTWTATAAAIGLRPGTDPHWPALLDQLADLSRAGVDAVALLRRAVAESPLPDEYVAAAIRWRITRHTTTTTATTTTTGADLLRPRWLPTLTGAVGPHLAERLTADPRWPAVVAAITRAAGHGITYQDLLVHPLGLDGTPVPDDALADALIYRAAVLSRPEPTDPDTEPDDHPAADQLPADSGWHDAHEAPLPDHLDLPAALREDLHDLASDEPDLPDVHDEDSWALRPHAQLTLAGSYRAGLPAWTPTDAQIAHQLDRAYEADTAPVPPERIHALNDHAAAFYQGCYPGSWSAGYLASRLGVDPTTDPSIRPGHAPAAWTALTDHLRRHGASDEELLAAGLAKSASTGRLIDTFRDRLILPIHTTTPTGATVIVGFVARRNPRHDQHDNPTAGPKYLNTPRTVAYTKGDHLYGVADAHDRLLDGATPVLVEGPIDALAVTLASPRHVGLAPLGTALTDTQADTLIPYLTRPAGLIIATDPDPAGHAAAERDYWMLSARGGEPRHAHLPAGLDPADLLTHHGPDPLHTILAHAAPMGDALIDALLSAGGPATMHDAVLVAAAGDQHHWAPRAHRIAAHLHLPHDSVVGALCEHINTWDGDRATAAHRAQTATLTAIRDRQTRLDAQPPHQRWAPLAGQLHPALPDHPHWPALAQTLQKAHNDGVNLHALLTDPAGPLDPINPVKDLAARLNKHQPLQPSTPRIDPSNSLTAVAGPGEHSRLGAPRQRPTPAPPPVPHP